MFARIAKHFKDKKEARRKKVEAEWKVTADLKHEQWLADCARDQARYKWEMERERERRAEYGKLEEEIRVKNRELALTMLPEERWMFYASIYLGPHLKKADHFNSLKDFPNLMMLGESEVRRLLIAKAS